MEREGNEEILPPGFRFHPTDEELITYYLVNKISDSSFTGRAIGDVDLNKSEPWELPGKAKMGEKEWYFFSLRDRKYPTGVRTNRATNTGYWKTTGKDKEIFNSVTSEMVGMKKTLVFYKGRAPRGEKTNWVMHEYRVHSKAGFRTAKDEWVVCRVFQKSAGVKKYPTSQSRGIHTYNLEIGPSSVPSAAMMMMQAENSQLPLGRNYMNMNNPEVAELTRLLRGGSAAGMMSLQPIQSQLNYSVGGGGGGGGGGQFSISGLNLNLGGAGQVGLRAPMMPPQHHQSLSNQQDEMSASILAGGSAIASETGYGADMSNVANSSRFMNMDNCMDLDGYWPSY